MRGYAQIDPKNEYKKEGFEKFELLKAAIADRVTDLAFKVEIKPAEAAPQAQPAQAPQAPPPKAVDAVTAQALLESMVTSHNLPPEVVDAVRRGAEGAARAVQAPAAAAPAAAAARAPAAAAAGGASISGAKRAGRNDPCPCGSGVKYKKCCHPAFG